MTREEFRAWCRTHKGLGYIFGATGWVATQERLEQQAKQYASEANTILVVGRKWLGKKCWDCAQWTKYCLKQFGINLPSGATSQWNSDNYAERGTMDTFPQNEDTTCIQLFRQDKKVTNKVSMAHTGLCLGDGKEMEARSTADGIIEDIISSKWTHWARPKGLTFDGALPTEDNPQLYEVTAPKAPLNVREAPGERNKWLGSLAKGTVVQVTSVANNWAHIKYGDGYTQEGYSSMNYLKKVNGV